MACPLSKKTAMDLMQFVALVHPDVITISTHRVFIYACSSLCTCVTQDFTIPNDHSDRSSVQTDTSIAAKQAMRTEEKNLGNSKQLEREVLAFFRA